MENRKLRKSTIYLLYSVGFVLLVGIAYLIEGTFTTRHLDDTTYVGDTIIKDKVKPVVAEEDKILRPFTDNEVKVLRDYYDYQGNEESQEKSIIEYNKTYMQNSGICYGGKDDFDVVSILDGKVIDIKDDDLLGTTVQIEHANNIISVYQSLKEVNVKVNDQVKAGDKIAKAGTNNLNKDLGTHLYFEIIADGTNLNPEKVYDKTIKEIKG
ncbi:MAG: M23 family metallopeptidase [Bacilli bacterium]|nr:M23 family metallopeptidase [Bacilli bacterium]